METIITISLFGNSYDINIQFVIFCIIATILYNRYMSYVIDAFDIAENDALRKKAKTIQSIVTFLLIFVMIIMAIENNSIYS